MYDFLCRQHTARPGGPGSGAAPAAEQRVALIRRECSPASGSLRSMVDAAGSSSQSIVIGASVSRVAEVIADFARYPEWTGALREAEILEEYEDGYASKVRFVLEAGPVRDEYTLAYEYAEDLTRIEWHLVEPSAVQKAQMGSYDIEDNGDGTCTVTYTLSVELSIGMLGMFRRKAEKVIMDTALRELKRRVESLAPEGDGDDGTAG